MTTITQTIDIPASRRLIIDVPSEVPTGRAVISFTPAQDDTKTNPADRERILKAIKNVEEGKNITTFKNLNEAKRYVKERMAAQ